MTQPPATTRRSRLLAATVSLILSAGAAHSQSPQANSARAQALFDTAGKLAAEGRYAEACPRYAESYQFDHTGGALYGLAACQEIVGKLASAWSNYTLFLSLPKESGKNWEEWTAESNKGVSRLSKKLSKLTIESDASNLDLPDFQVRRDGAELRPAEMGVAMPVDGGEHTIEASAKGRVLWSKKLVFEPQFDSKTLKIPALERAPPSPAASSSVPAATSPAPHQPPPVAPPKADLTAGLLLAGVGVAGLAVGTYFGISASSTWKTVKQTCPQRVCSDAGAVDDYKSASRAALVSDIGLGVGVVALGVGAYLLLSAPAHDAGQKTSATTIVPLLSRSGGGLSMMQSW
jgi:hypothetical protein